MTFEMVSRFLGKTPDQRRHTLRFFARKSLARWPYFPMRLRLAIPPDEEMKFWWSYVSELACDDRPLLDYWGNDLGELRFLWRILQPSQVFFDVGAFHGLYTTIAAKKMRDSGTLIAFEPSPRERSRFRLHLRLNRIVNARLEPFAIGADRGTATLFTVLEGHKTMNSLVRPPIDSPLREVPVESVGLDEYVERAGVSRIDVLKVDTEGGERQVFAGAKRVLSEFRPFIICEVLDWVTKGWGYPAREVIACLQNHDYVWFDFHDDGTLSRHVPRDEYPEVQNYLAVPREKLARIQQWCSHE